MAAKIKQLSSSVSADQALTLNELGALDKLIENLQGSAALPMDENSWSLIWKLLNWNEDVRFPGMTFTL